MEKSVKDYYQGMLEEWHSRFPLRNPLLCIKIRCEHICFPFVKKEEYYNHLSITETHCYECKLINNTNERIKEGILDFERALDKKEKKDKRTGERWILESFMRNAHNINMSADDLFPTHLVHPSCPHLLDHLMKSGKDE